MSDQDPSGDPTRVDTPAADPTMAMPATGSEPPTEPSVPGEPPSGPPPTDEPPAEPPDRRPWIIAGLLVLIALVALALLLGGDDDDDASTGSSTTTSTTSSTTTTTAPPTTTTTAAPTTTTAAPPSTIDPADCVSSGPGDPAPTAEVVYDAYTVDDRECASNLMTADALEDLFAIPGGGAGWTFQGCEEVAGPDAQRCGFSFPGGSTSFSMEYGDDVGWTVFEVSQTAD